MNRYRLRSPHRDHLTGAYVTDGIYVEAVQWKPGEAMPSWCSYCIDPQSLPGSLLIVTPNGEDIAHSGDMIMRSERGVQAIDKDVFFRNYKESN